jgi:hypothetical protein
VAKALPFGESFRPSKVQFIDTSEAFAKLSLGLRLASDCASFLHLGGAFVGGWLPFGLSPTR